MKAAGIDIAYTPVEEVADRVVAGILADDFWIHPQSDRGDAQLLRPHRLDARTAPTPTTSGPSPAERPEVENSTSSTRYRISSSPPTATPGCRPRTTAQYLSSDVPPRSSTSSSASARPQLEAMTALGVRNEDYAKQWFEEHEEALRSGWDADRRDLELDGDGVAGEVVFPDADAVESRTCVPFGAGLGMSGDMDPRARARRRDRRTTGGSPSCARTAPSVAAGSRSCRSPRRLDDVLAEIRRIKDDGLGAVMIPAMWVNQTPYHDRRYDPVWALCEELELPIVTHSGPADRGSYGDHLGIYVTEVTWWPARPLWFMLWSGVFERLPGLQVRRDRGRAAGGCPR